MDFLINLRDCEDTHKTNMYMHMQNAANLGTKALLIKLQQLFSQVPLLSQIQRYHKYNLQCSAASVHVCITYIYQYVLLYDGKNPAARPGQ